VGVLDLALLLLGEVFLLSGHRDGGPVEVAHRACHFLVGGTRLLDLQRALPGESPFCAVAGVAFLVGWRDADYKVFGDRLAGFFCCQGPLFAEVGDLDVCIGLGGGILLLLLLLLLLWCWCWCCHWHRIVLLASWLLGVVLLSAGVGDPGWLLANWTSIAGRRGRNGRPGGTRGARELLRLAFVQGDEPVSGHLNYRLRQREDGMGSKSQCLS
jgi:hypothetical protein